MKILINGESREVPDDISLEQLVIQLELPRQRIAVELNKNVVRRADWTNALLKEGDRVEIVHFVGGGMSTF
ncbi:MAG TPA: sulfur carrier protein ThiS [Pyrinomonadaceae bacterium]|nr:sulfur carrier protein ThiS [Pyrinomonadaceae bacterium]